MVSKPKESLHRKSLEARVPSTRTRHPSKTPRKNSKLLKPWNGGAGTIIKLKRNLKNLRHRTWSSQTKTLRQWRRLSRNKTLKSSSNTMSNLMKIINSNNIMTIITSVGKSRDITKMVNTIMTTGANSSTQTLEIIIQCSQNAGVHNNT